MKDIHYNFKKKHYHIPYNRYDSYCLWSELIRGFTPISYVSLMKEKYNFIFIETNYGIPYHHSWSCFSAISVNHLWFGGYCMQLAMSVAGWKQAWQVLLAHTLQTDRQIDGHVHRLEMYSGHIAIRLMSTIYLPFKGLFFITCLLKSCKLTLMWPKACCILGEF